MSATCKICIQSYLIFALLTSLQQEVNNVELYLTRAQMDISWMRIAQVMVNKPVIVLWNIVGRWPV